MNTDGKVLAAADRSGEDAMRCREDISRRVVLLSLQSMQAQGRARLRQFPMLGRLLAGLLDRPHTRRVQQRVL